MDSLIVGIGVIHRRLEESKPTPYQFGSDYLLGELCGLTDAEVEAALAPLDDFDNQHPQLFWGDTKCINTTPWIGRR